MSKLVLIGCSPSSGSTMFADLLDSSSHSACGPELEFFCNRSLFDFENFKANPKKQSELFSIGSTGIFPRYERLKHYGLNESALNQMIQSSSSVEQFTSAFAKHFLRVREKSSPGIVFEKTPQNANSIDLWMENAGNHFVFVVRDPFYVMNSLMNRGWSLYTSLVTWLSYYGKAKAFLGNPRFHIIHLEKLVENPFGVSSSLINNLVGAEVTNSKELKDGYEHNTYRKQSSKRKVEWEIQGTADGIRNPNEKQIEEERINMFSMLGNVQLSKAYINRFGLMRESLSDAMNELGYDTYRFNESSALVIKPDSRDHKKFASKSFRAWISGNGPLSDWNIYRSALDFSR